MMDDRSGYPSGCAIITKGDLRDQELSELEKVIVEAAVSGGSTAPPPAPCRGALTRGRRALAADMLEVRGAEDHPDRMALGSMALRAALVTAAAGALACGSYASYPASKVGRIPANAPPADERGRLPSLGLSQAETRGCESDDDCTLTFLVDPERSCCDSTVCQPHAYNRVFLPRLLAYRKHACRVPPRGCLQECFCKGIRWEPVCVEGLCAVQDWDADPTSVSAF